MNRKSEDKNICKLARSGKTSLAVAWQNELRTAINEIVKDIEGK